MKKYLAFQVVLAIFAVIFAITNIAFDFYSYYKGCGSLLPIPNNLTHPFFTACFYGGFAFILCLVLSLLVYRSVNIKVQKYLVALSLFGAAFAYGNMYLEINRYLNAGMSTYKGCSGLVVSSPILTPCFIGSVFFTFIAFVSIYIFLKIKKV